jgi:hypothetical protein
MTKRPSIPTKPEGHRLPKQELLQEDNLTPEQRLEHLDETLTCIEYDLDILARAFGLLMKEHNLEQQWNDLKRLLSERRRNIID